MESQDLTLPEVSKEEKCSRFYQEIHELIYELITDQFSVKKYIIHSTLIKFIKIKPKITHHLNHRK